MQPKTKIWHPAGFVTLHLLAMLLFSSWLYGPTRELWDALDASVFYTLNGTLAWGHGWELLWAITNHRGTDVAVGILMIVFFWDMILAGEKHLRIERMVAFGFMSIIILVCAEGRLVVVYQEILDLERLSPSLVLEPVYRISELVPWISAKDAAKGSFPGDHGTISLIWLTFIMIYAGWGHRLTALILVALIWMPRLASGAHWLSDNLVGSASLVMLILAWFTCTPVGFIIKGIGHWVLDLLFPHSWRRPAELS